MTSVYRGCLLSSLLLLLPLPHWCVEAQDCALYKPSSPGIHCLRQDGAGDAVRVSRWVWMMEFYSSWCGHCQNFAPRLKQLAEELEAWSSVVRIGVLECTESKENQKVCGKFGVQAYPTIRVCELLANVFIFYFLNGNGSLARIFSPWQGCHLVYFPVCLPLRWCCHGDKCVQGVYKIVFSLMHVL